MIFISWNEKNNISIDEINQQHQQLVVLANQLHKKLGKKSEREEIRKTLGAILSYEKYHFSFEEHLMDIIDYPGSAEHKALHEKLSIQVNNMRNRFDKKQPISGSEILDFLRKCITEHIPQEDKKYADYIDQNMKSQTLSIIAWDQTCHTGEEEIDNDHKNIMELFNQIQANLAFEHDLEATSSKIDVLMEALYKHIDTEEQQMLEIMYPKLNDSINEHHIMLSALGDLKDMIKSDDQQAFDDVSSTIKDCISKHIKSEAMSYVKYITDNKIDINNMYIKWKPAYTVTIDEMDYQHIEIIKLLNLLHNMYTGSKHSEECLPTLNSLINTFKTHFFAEENLMRRIKYTYFKDHKKEHDNQIRNILFIQKSLRTGQKVNIPELTSSLRDWILRHIQIHDRKYGEFFNDYESISESLFMSWKHEYSVGIEKIDNQHKDIVQLINRIYSGMKNNYKKAEIGGFLDELRAKIASHYLKEEEFLKLSGYPKQEQHQRNHDKMVKQILMMRIWNQSSPAYEDFKELRKLKDQYQNHIRYDDKKYADFIADKNAITNPVF
jgi:hemerythrin